MRLLAAFPVAVDAEKQLQMAAALHRPLMYGLGDLALSYKSETVSFHHETLFEIRQVLQTDFRPVNLQNGAVFRRVLPA